MLLLIALATAADTTEPTEAGQLLTGEPQHLLELDPTPLATDLRLQAVQGECREIRKERIVTGVMSGALFAAGAGLATVWVIEEAGGVHLNQLKAGLKHPAPLIGTAFMWTLGTGTAILGGQEVKQRAEANGCGR